MSEAQIIKKLERIEKDLSFIKEHIIDADLIITDDDLESISQAEDDLKTGKTERIV